MIRKKLRKGSNLLVNTIILLYFLVLFFFVWEYLLLTVRMKSITKILFLGICSRWYRMGNLIS